MKQRPILFTHSQYNFTIYLHAEILWRTFVHLALQRHVAKYLKKVHVDQIWYISTYRELTLTHEGFDCDREMEFILRCTRQWSTAGMFVCVSWYIFVHGVCVCVCVCVCDRGGERERKRGERRETERGRERERETERDRERERKRERDKGSPNTV